MRPPADLTLRKPLALLICTIALTALGCGGGGAAGESSTTTPKPNIVGISGTWTFTLSYDQVLATGGHASNLTVTRVTVILTQDVAGSTSTISSSAGGSGNDLACTSPAAGTWSTPGASTLSGFTLTSGTIQSSAINLTLHEFANFVNVPPGITLPTGTMTFMGTLNADGTMSGTTTDTCVLDANGDAKQGTWTAVKI